VANFGTRKAETNWTHACGMRIYRASGCMQLARVRFVSDRNIFKFMYDDDDDDVQ